MPNQPKRQPELTTLQVGRGLAAFAVVLYHADGCLGSSVYFNRPFFPIFVGGGMAGVEFFFVLSGFIILYAHFRDLGRPDRLGNYISKRFFRIYPPVWIILLLVLPFYLFMPGLNRLEPVDGRTIVSSFAILPVAGERDFLAVEWSLYHEVLFYVVFALVIWRLRLGLIVAGIWVLLSPFSSIWWPSFPAGFLFSNYHLFFALGAAAFLLHRREGLKHPRTALLVGGLIFAGGWGLAAFDETLSRQLVTDVLAIGSALVILGAVTLERLSPGLRMPWTLTFLGDASYALYLTHYLVISALCKVLKAHDHSFPLPDAVKFLVVVLAAIITGVAFHLAVEKPLNHLRRRPATSEPVRVGG
jgi:peptidoglycan/LPS O-acetylase OafA/YrhL